MCSLCFLPAAHGMGDLICCTSTACMNISLSDPVAFFICTQILLCRYHGAAYVLCISHNKLACPYDPNSM